MRRFRTIIIVSLLGLSVLFGYLYWSRTQQPAAENTSVRIATFSTAIDYAPFYIARELRFFEEELGKVGAAPAYSTFESLPPLNDSLRSRQLDVVFEAEPPALIAEAAGTDIIVPRLSAILRQQIIVRQGAGIRSVADLRGRSIGVLTGTSSHYGLIQVLQRNGLSANDVRIVNLPPPEARAAFESGRIDAWAIWPPFPEVEVLAGRATALPNSEAPIVSLVVVRGDFNQNSEPQTRAVLTALQRAQRLIGEDPARARAIVARATRQPIEVVNAAWPRHDFQAQISPAVVSQIQATADFLRQGGYLGRAVNVSNEVFSAE